MGFVLPLEVDFPLLLGSSFLLELVIPLVPARSALRLSGDVEEFSIRTSN